ncbi:hypothetical protein QNM97_16255 [Gordonia sp. L191]|uniref:hypothetical protein n=1 Tax=Gordonia sp. L191 TaxID=2982699 RepID=UPI0024C0BBDA|nr:hypothetical protein [Gordonia sp. L191]WHU45571.1 hypothetical protein QNM97_16255 [Gordonia sp. L191]
MSEIDDFRQLYERHVGHVVAGDMAAAVADIAPATLDTIFEGVLVPRRAVESFEIVDVRSEGRRMVGEAVYRGADGIIGLRSVWERRDDSWQAVALANFTPANFTAAGAESPTSGSVESGSR